MDNVTVLLIGILGGVLLSLSVVALYIGNLASRKDKSNVSHR